MILDAIVLAASLAATDPATDSAPGPSPDTAGPAAPPSDMTIVVTGERVDRILRETASSVVVVPPEAIEAASIDRLDQALALVPNVQAGSGEEGPAIRGQDSTGLLRNLFAFLGGTRPRVTLQIDGRAASYYEFVSGAAPLWDVERIEVFRTPQTTTQGRNSIAGAIFVETADPTYDWQGRSRFIIGDAETRQLSAVVSGPLAAGQLAFRASGDVRFARNSSDMADGIEGADIDRDDYRTARLKLLYEPAAAPDLRIETTYAYVDSQSPQFEAVRAPFERRRTLVEERTNGIHRIRSHALTLRARYDPASALSAGLTVSHGDALVRRFGLPGLGQTRVDARDDAIEATLRWRPSPRFTLLGGTHYLATRQDQFIDITGLAIGSGDFRDRQESVGLFGEAEWRPLPPLRLSLGLRYQHDSQDRAGQVGPLPGGILLDYDRSFDFWLPRLSLSYDFADRVTAGVLVQKAANPGGASIALRTRREDSFEAERLWNYEAFLRARSSDGRVAVSANIFRADIRDAQRQQLVPVPLPDGTSADFTEFSNAPRARTKGMEVEQSWRIDPRLTLRAGAGFLDTRTIATVLPGDRTLGKQFQRSPRFTGVLAADWQPVEGLKLSLQGRHHSGYFSDDTNDPRLRIEPATIVDLRASYSFGKVTVFAYALNALDEFHLTYLFSPTFGTAGDPRQVAAGIETRF